MLHPWNQGLYAITITETPFNHGSWMGLFNVVPDKEGTTFHFPFLLSFHPHFVCSTISDT
uniref:Uncharacterized protein n=1 Tax=Rhizophora mucronata TaxID=61149 RepID=A0A2P2KJZ8_RHIMU